MIPIIRLRTGFIVRDIVLSIMYVCVDEVGQMKTKKTKPNGVPMTSVPPELPSFAPTSNQSLSQTPTIQAT
jgi:hypothetical protein